MRRDNEYFLKITNKEFDEKVKDRREYEECLRQAVVATCEIFGIEFKQYYTNRDRLSIRFEDRESRLKHKKDMMANSLSDFKKNSPQSKRLRDEFAKRWTKDYFPRIPDFRDNMTDDQSFVRSSEISYFEAEEGVYFGHIRASDPMILDNLNEDYEIVKGSDYHLAYEQANEAFKKEREVV